MQIGSHLSDATSIGGAYTAKDNGDGTFDVLDVEIMAEVPKGEKGAPEDVGRAWLQAAVDKAQERLNAGYMAPLHIRHHDTGVATVPAGFMVPTRIERRMYDGRATWTMLADLRRVPSAIFAKIRNAEIPYRSVEVARWSKPEIQSLALLEDDAPYFKFELLTIGKVISEQRQEAGRLEAVSAPAMAYAAAGEGALVLFSFRGGKMAYDEKKDEKKDEVKGGEADENRGPLKPEPGTDTPAAEKVNAAEMEPAGAPADKGGDMGALFETKLNEFGTRMLAAMQALLGADEELPKEEHKPADQESSKHDEQKKMNESAVLEARLSAMEAKEEKRDAKETLEALVSDAREQLKGWATTAHTVAKMRTIAEKDPSGEALKAFVETYRSAVPKDAPARLEDAMAGTKVDCEEVMAYAKHGPEILEKVRKFSALYDQAVASNMTESSRSRWIEIQLRADRATKAEK